MSRLERLMGRRKGLSLPAGASWVPPVVSSVGGMRGEVAEGFEAAVEGAFRRSGVVFACMMARALPFSEARFQFQQLSGGRPGDLFGAASLGLLERPWPNGTTGELLMRLIQDADLSGNAYVARVDGRDGPRLRRLRPDWVTIVTGVEIGDEWALDAQPVLYMYRPPTGEPVTLPPDRVAHWSPTPDPALNWRGMSWLTPVLREIEADRAAMEHKRQFFQLGTVSNLAVSYDPGLTPEQFRAAVADFEELYAGPHNAGRVLHFGGGADPKPLSLDMRALDFRATQGHGETRIAAAAGVGAIIARFSEGLSGSSLNQGNYAAAKRQFADMTLRPLWRSVCAALEVLVQPPEGGPARLWYDARDVAFLAEDEMDSAEIMAKDAQTVRTLIDAGYEPDAVVSAVAAGDLRRLTGSHSGLFSVQLQAAGAAEAEEEANS